MFHNPKKIFIWALKFHIWNNADVNGVRITAVINSAEKISNCSVFETHSML